MSKKKRERRKKCRRKYQLTTEQSTQCRGPADGSWKLPEVHSILNRTVAAPYSLQQFQMLKNQSDNFLLRQSTADVLAEVDGRCVNDLHEFTKLIRRNFAKTRLRRILNDCLPTGAKFSPVRLINLFVTPKQLNAFVERLFDRIFPTDLLGAANWRRLRENVARVFSRLRARGETATFAELARRLRFSEVRWLRAVPFRLKLNVVSDIAEYVASFFINILCTFFYSTMNSAGQIVHYRRSVWRCVERRSFAILAAQRMLKEVAVSGEQIAVNTPIHRLRFLPKPNDVRPIVTFKNDRVVRELAEVRAILMLLIDECPAILGWGISNLRNFNVAYRRKTLALKKSTADGGALPNIYWGTLDLANCFTTINHDMLEKILYRLIPVNSTFIVVRTTIESERAGRRFLVRVGGRTYSHAMSRLRLRGNERMGSNPVSVRLSGADVLARIRQFVLRTVIARHGRLYRCRRGIAQGNPLSVKLCNIYLGSVERILFPQRPRELFCKRYIDDYFVLSADKSSIVQMIDKIKNDGARFGIQMNDKKVLLSFAAPSIATKRLKTSRKLPWCGFAFNTKTLCMTVDYQRYRRCEPRYSINIRLHPTDRLPFICATAKRLLKGRCVALRRCARVMSVTQRRAMRADFCKFAQDFYFRHFIRQLRLDMRDATVRHFFSQMMRWVGNCFRERFICDAANPAVGNN